MFTGFAPVGASESDDGLTIGDWEIAKDVAEWIEIAAIAVITVAIFVAFVAGVRGALRGRVIDGVESFKTVIGRGLLVGLDLLISADVIKTVTLQPTLENVTALGLLVVIRSVLAWSLIIELTGRWPWQGEPVRSSGPGATG